MIAALLNSPAARGISMRMRIWRALCVAGLLVGLTSVAWAQPVGPFGPGRGPLPPPFPVRGGVAPSPKQGGEAPRPRRTGGVARMKLLAPNVGWAMSMRRLMWTSSGGTEWEDITPPGPSDALISAVFFLDTSRGWVLFAHGESDIPGGTQFDLAPRTTPEPLGRWNP